MSAASASRAAKGNESLVKNILNGHIPRLDNFLLLMDVLGVYVSIGTRPRDAAAAESIHTKPPEKYVQPPPESGLAPVRDRRLAELLAALADHWESLGSDYARRTWVEQMYHDHPALSAQRSARLSRTSAGG